MTRLYIYNKVVLTVAFGIAIWLFWWLCYPHALSYQEQYQLFLTDFDYLAGRLGVAGGLADYVGEALTQFYYVPCLGAALLALLFVAIQRLMWRLMEHGQGCYPLSFVPPVLLLWLMGDESVLASYAVALTGVMGAAAIAARRQGQSFKREALTSLVAAPLLYWLLGPMAWLYVALSIVRMGWRRSLWLPLWLLGVIVLLHKSVMAQWPLSELLLTRSYYRVPLQMPTLMAVIPAVVLMLAVGRWEKTGRRWMAPLGCAIVAALAWLAIGRGFDKEKYELIRQDYLVRQERWDELIERAQRHQVRTAFSSVSVNLALAMKRQLAERMFEFYQSGEDALIMPSIRDLTSDLPSAEAFFRLGLVNSAQRYMFDIQESILNGKRSGRCTQRLAECMIVNGHYAAAAKQLQWLKRSLFYRQWAGEAEKLLGRDDLVDAHPQLGRLRKLRFKSDFLFSYPELEKVLGLLFTNNPDNKMALDYFMAQLLLKGEVQQFMQYMPWVQQYGGYKYMPVGYQDAVRCIQTQGREGGKYGQYVQRMLKSKQQ